MFHIVLLEPRMPGNVGTIGRLAVATGCMLHLIKPYGFKAIDEEKVKRAGMDYWADLNYVEYDSLEDFWKLNPLNERHFFTSKKATKSYFQVTYKDSDYFYFGREDVGLPQSLTGDYPNSCISIPMVNGARSLNIANAVSVVVYEAWRQNS
ncbi:MAG: RNA methyltransferase [Bacteroidetes bacterium]|nr:MAG: RNA methyltransferase [Bacteroidota bacterium]